MSVFKTAVKLLEKVDFDKMTKFKTLSDAEKVARKDNVLSSGGFKDEEDMLSMRSGMSSNPNANTGKDLEAQALAKKVEEGSMTFDEYRDWWLTNRSKSPATKAPDVVPPDRALASVGKKVYKTGLTGEGGTVNIPDGTQVASRLDIPAYSNKGEYVETLHNPAKQTDVMGYGGGSDLSDVIFGVNPDAALGVATNRTDKHPFHMMKGKYKNNPNIVEDMNKLMGQKNVIQVGANPQKSGAFYDIGNGKALEGADRVIQIGDTLVAKNPKYIPDGDPRLTTKGGVQFGGAAGAALLMGEDE
jgi:hypothetical protein